MVVETGNGLTGSGVTRRVPDLVDGDVGEVLDPADGVVEVPDCRSSFRPRWAVR
jgi:hypothetical protein